MRWKGGLKRLQMLMVFVKREDWKEAVVLALNPHSVFNQYNVMLIFQKQTNYSCIKLCRCI